MIRDQTLAEKVMSRLVGRAVYAGEFVELQPDWTFSLDDGIGLVDRYFKTYNVTRIADPDRIALFYDHFAPADTPQHAYVQRLGRKLAERFGIKRLYDVGDGISHQIAVESGLVRPGQMVTNTDSHTITVGAVGAVGCGIGVAEMAFLWAHGRLWFQVPSSLRIQLSGQLRPGVTAKDLVLSIVKQITARGAMYSSIEYHGDALPYLGIPERMTLCNMGIEMGAKFAVVPGDSVTRAHYAGLGIDVGSMVQPDPNANYVAQLQFDVTEVSPMVSAPNKVDNVHGVGDFADVEIHQAFLGTCTNGRFEDLAIAAQILVGKRLAPGVRMIVTPASREVYLRALKEGVINQLVEAGCTVTTPGCGACAGIHQGVLAAEEVCISSSSRNFLGRMGNRDAAVYLGSPATVAASALRGKITDPRTVLNR
jgi:homoaconitate hydratase family protein